MSYKHSTSILKQINGKGLIPVNPTCNRKQRKNYLQWSLVNIKKTKDFRHRRMTITYSRIKITYEDSSLRIKNKEMFNIFLNGDNTLGFEFTQKTLDDDTVQRN